MPSMKERGKDAGWWGGKDLDKEQYFKNGAIFVRDTPAAHELLSGISVGENRSARECRRISRVV